MTSSDLGSVGTDAIAGDHRVVARPIAVAAPIARVAVFGCGPDEAVLFRELGLRLGVEPLVIEAAISEDNADLALGSRCVSVSHRTRITHAALLALRRAGVEYISTRSIGYDHIDLAYAARLGISVGNVAYSPDSVADYTVMLMLMVLRHARRTVLGVEVRDYRLGESRGKELRDLVVGVIGTGRIGTAVIRRLQGFGCRVLTHDSRPGAAPCATSLDELLQRSDIVTLHTPLTADTHHLLDRKRIELMKDGAYVVNTGRGPLLDTEALLSALEDGTLGGAALDVLEGEEGIFYADCRDRLIENSVLLRLQLLPNVLISPHAAYYTDHALNDTVENSLINCRNFESEKRA